MPNSDKNPSLREAGRRYRDVQIHRYTTDKKQELEKEEREMEAKRERNLRH